MIKFLFVVPEPGLVFCRRLPNGGRIGGILSVDARDVESAGSAAGLSIAARDLVVEVWRDLQDCTALVTDGRIPRRLQFGDLSAGMWYHLDEPFLSDGMLIRGSNGESIAMKLKCVLEVQRFAFACIEGRQCLGSLLIDLFLGQCVSGERLAPEVLLERLGRWGLLVQEEPWREKGSIEASVYIEGEDVTWVNCGSVLWSSLDMDAAGRSRNAAEDALGVPWEGVGWTAVQEGDARGWRLKVVMDWDWMLSHSCYVEAVCMLVLDVGRLVQRPTL